MAPMLADHRRSARHQRARSLPERWDCRASGRVLGVKLGAMLNLLALSAGKVDHRVIGCGSVCKTPLFGLVEQRYRPLGVGEYGRALIA